MVELKGIHKVTSKGRVYYYAWRGGPRLDAEPGTPDFHAAYNEAVAGRIALPADRFRSVVARYKASQNYLALAPSTRRQWARWLDGIASHFGDLRTAQFARTERIRPVIRKWRGRYADRPRTADYAMQVLSRVCAFAVDPLGELPSNPCEGIKRLYSADRSEIIWTDADISAAKAAGSEELGWAFDLAAHTGLRLGDLVALSWSHIGEHEIVVSTGKGRRKGKRAIVPLYGALREVLRRIPKRATTVLTTTRGQPWKVNGISTAINRAKTEAGLQEGGLHFHDLRGTAATKFYLAGLELRVIAEILAWEEETVERIIRRYVGRQAATLAAIQRLDGAGK